MAVPGGRAAARAESGRARRPAEQAGTAESPQEPLARIRGGSGGAATCSAVTACGGCLAWDFESTGSADAWLLGLSPSFSLAGANGASNVLLTHSRYQSPDTALAVPILIDQATAYTAEVAVSPCPSDDSINLAGYALTARVFLSGPELTTWSDALQLDTWGPSGPGDYFVLEWGSNPIPTGTWFSITAAFTSSAPVNRIGLRLTPSSNWSGTLYLDDVAIDLAI